jgi:hypothetical protein
MADSVIGPRQGKQSWFYRSETGGEVGPVPAARLATIINKADLPATTEVRLSTETQWSPLNQVERLSLPVSIAFDPSTDYLPHPRPWLRYFAKIVDMLFGLAVTGALMLYLPHGIRTGVPGYLMLIVGWLTLESLCLMQWGTTPGKFLIRTSVRKLDGSRLRFSDAITRSIDAYIRGLAFGIPLIQLLVSLVAFYRLRGTGETLWDRDGGYVVLHKKLGVPRILIILVAGSLILGLLNSIDKIVS